MATSSPSAAPSPSPTKPPIGDVPFDLLERFREAVRQSPSHLEFEAERLVQAKDAQKLFEFVRDEIGVYPPGLYNADQWGAMRWGTAATLRGGAGTPRERAELLAELYKRAGFQAELVVANEPALDPIAFFRVPKRTFSPGITDQEVIEWRRAAGLRDQAAALPEFDAHGESAAIADALAALLPADLAARDFPPPNLSSLVAVKVTVDGTARLAHLVPGGALATDGLNRTFPASPAGPLISVKISLSMATTKLPSLQIPLVSASFTADQIVGRPAWVRFVSPGDIGTLLDTTAGDVGLLVPTIQLLGPRDDPGSEADLTTGPAITVRGEVVEEVDGAVRVNGIELDAPPDDLAALVAKVASLEVQVAGAFPWPELRVGALDSSGASVSGLPASAFGVTDESAVVRPMMLSNHQDPPRIVVVYDASSSPPPEFVSPEGRRAFGRALAGGILAEFPDAQFQALGTTLEDASPDAFASVTADGFGEILATMRGGVSAVLTAIRNANHARPSLIVALSDFVTDESAGTGLGQFRALIASGAPVLAITTGGAAFSNLAVAEDVAKLSGGKKFDALTTSDVSAAVDAAVELLGAARRQHYRLTYQAPAEGPTLRHVSVTVGSAPAANGTYQVPDASTAPAPPSVAGLYLTIEVSGEIPVTRTLAGIPDQPRPSDDVAVSAADADAARRALFDTVAVSVEGRAPSLAVWLDDSYTARLSTRALWEAAAAGDSAGMRNALDKGISPYASDLIGLHAPLPDQADGEPLVYERSVRIALASWRPGWKPGGQRHGDIVPLTKFHALDTDRKQAFRHVLRASARLAVGEAAIFDRSTLSELKGAGLTFIKGGVATPESFASMTPEVKQAWQNRLVRNNFWHMFLPTTGAPAAFWSVDPETGSLLGVLEDGTGGGAAGGGVPCDEFYSDALLSSLGALGAGPYAAIGKACARIFALAGRMLVPGPVKGPNDPDAIMKDLACDLIKDAAFGKMGHLGEAVVGPADNMADTGGLGLPCPVLGGGGGPAPSC